MGASKKLDASRWALLGDVRDDGEAHATATRAAGFDALSSFRAVSFDRCKLTCQIGGSAPSSCPLLSILSILGFDGWLGLWAGSSCNPSSSCWLVVQVSCAVRETSSIIATKIQHVAFAHRHDRACASNSDAVPKTGVSKILFRLAGMHITRFHPERTSRPKISGACWCSLDHRRDTDFHP